MTMARQAMANPTPPQTDEYVTPDLGQAAFCVALEMPLLAVRTEAGRGFFVFPAAARAVGAKFFQPGGDLVSARRFHMALRDLRALAREAVR